MRRTFVSLLLALRGGRPSRPAPVPARLGVEALDDRLLPSVSPWPASTLLAAQYASGLQATARIMPPLLQAPDLHGQSVALKDASGNDLGTLRITTENADGTFTGTFNGFQLDPGARLTPTGVQFSMTRHEGYTYDMPVTQGGRTSIVQVPLDRVEHFTYSGSLSASASGYSTTGWLTRETYFVYTDPSTGVSTYVGSSTFPGLPDRTTVTVAAHGDFNTLYANGSGTLTISGNHL
jgi:hypothetical protein